MLNNGDIPELLCVESAKFSNHTARLRFAEEDLYSAIFENADGSRTMYVSSVAIKYYDEDGKIKDKSMKVVKSNDGFSVEKTDIKLYFKDLNTSGITVKKFDHVVTMKPLRYDKSTLSEPSIDESKNTVKYKNVFATGIDIKYTPIASGVKEDIVINEYNGINTFSFVVQTGGLALSQDKQGRVYAIDTNDNLQFQFGDIIVYDENNNLSEGNYTIETIEPYKEYKLTLNVDADYLKTAMYPVVVDPYIFSYSGDTKNFLDTTIYSDGSLTSGGYMTNNKIGYISSGKYAMTLMKFPGFYTSSLYLHNKNSITSMSLNIYCGSIGSSVSAVKAYAFTGSAWDENANPTSILKSNAYTSTGEKLSGSKTIYSFDLLSILNGWRNNSIDPVKGILINTTNCTASGSYVNLYSADAGNYRPTLTITYNEGVSADIDEDLTYMIVTSDSSKAVQVGSDNKCVQYDVTYKSIEDKTFNDQLFKFEYWDLGLYYIKTIDGKKLTYSSSGNHLLTFTTENSRDYQLWYIVRSDYLLNKGFHFVPYLYVGKSLSTSGNTTNNSQLVATDTTNNPSNFWQLRVCLDVPLSQQAHYNTCGAACALMALDFLNVISYTNQSSMEKIFAGHIINGGEISEGGEKTPPRLLIDGSYDVVTTPSSIETAMGYYTTSPRYEYVNLKTIADNQYGDGYDETEQERKTAFAECIEKNIVAGYPVIAQAKIIDQEYFGYTSDGHYVLVVGFYECLGEKMLIVNDPHHAQDKGKQLVVSMDKLYEYVEEKHEYILSVYHDGL